MPWPQRYAGCSRRADSGVAYSGILIFNQRVASSWDGYAARQTTLETSDALPFDVYVVLVEQHDLTDP